MASTLCFWRAFTCLRGAVGVFLLCLLPYPHPLAAAPQQPAAKARAAAKNSASKHWHTKWNGWPSSPPKALDDFDPAVTLPADPSQFTWHITITRMHPNALAAVVPIFQQDILDQKLKPAGSRPEGLEVELDALRSISRLHYYRVKPRNNPGESFWVIGSYLKAKAKRP